MSVGGPGEVLVPASVREIVPGAGITFAEHGVHQLKGLDGEFRLFGVTGVDGLEVVPPLEAEEAAERRREIFPAQGEAMGADRGPAAGILAIASVAWLVFGDDPGEARGGLPGPLPYAVASRPRDWPNPFHDASGLREQIGDTTQFVDHPLVAGEGGVWMRAPPRLLHFAFSTGTCARGAADVGAPTSQTARRGSTGLGADGPPPLPGAPRNGRAPAVPRHSSRPRHRDAARASRIPLGRRQRWTLVRMDPATEARDQTETDSLRGRDDDQTALWVANIVASELTQVDPRLPPADWGPPDTGGSTDHGLSGGGTTSGSSTARSAPSLGSTASPTGGFGPGWATTRQTSGSVSGPSGSPITAGLLYRVDAPLEVEEFPLGAEVLAVAVDEARGDDLGLPRRGRSIRPPRRVARTCE